MVSVLQRCLSYSDSNKESKERQDSTVVSVLRRCPSYRDSDKRSIRKAGINCGVQFTEVSILKVSIKRVDCTYMYQIIKL